jgi:hypothetical protein
MAHAMKQLPGERTLLSSDDDRLVLTTHRVRYHARLRGFQRFTSIMLEQVSACEIIYFSRPWLLMAALLTLVLSFYFPTPGNVTSRTISWLVAIVLVFVYLGTRRQVISVRSAGGAINVPTRGMGLEKAQEFIDTLEEAADRRSPRPQRAAGA